MWKKPISTSNQLFLKIVLGALTVLCGLKLTWASLNGSFLQILKQVLIVIVALGLGRTAGRLLHLQKASNRIGQFARRKMTEETPTDPNRFSNGFAVCALLFCAAPLGIIGAVADGTADYFCPLIIKAAMDGLGAMSFVGMFGTGVLLSAVPVLVFQGTITMLSARFLLPLLEHHGLLDSLNATSGMLIFCVALVIFEIKKIQITDYLPSLVFAPLLTLLFR